MLQILFYDGKHLEKLFLSIFSVYFHNQIPTPNYIGIQANYHVRFQAC